MNWSKIFLKHCFEASSSLILCNTNHFSIRLWCSMKSEFYVTTSDDQLSGRTKKKLQSNSQSQICTKRRSWSLFGSLLPVWSTIAFWILVKPLHLRSMLSKPMDASKTAMPATSIGQERAQFFSMTMSNHMPHNQCFKTWTNCEIVSS